MEPEIVNLSTKQLVGMRASMTLATDSTFQLWQSFMPRRSEISNRLGDVLFSMQIFAESMTYSSFTAETEFEKWAAVEVREREQQQTQVPEGMEPHRLVGGLYAVFMHYGPASTFRQTLEKFYVDWLPESEYDTDKREHFEILQPGYRPDDLNAEEEVWIPVKVR